jgi:CRP-like cAMP-binding protein
MSNRTGKFSIEASEHAEALAGLGVLRGLDEAERAQFYGLLERRDVVAGERIIAEGERCSELILLLDGEADLYKRAPDSEQNYRLGTLATPVILGELSFVDDEPASATVTVTRAGVAWTLTRAAVEQLPLFRALVANIARTATIRLRASSDNLARSMEQQLKEEKLRNDFGRFYITTLVLFGLFNLFPNTELATPLMQMTVGWVALLGILVPVAFLVIHLKAPLREFGLTTRGWRRSVAEAVLLSAAALPLLAGWRYVTMAEGELFFSWRTMAHYSPRELALFLALYSMHGAIQEFIARGVMQGGLTRFMRGSHFMIPVVLASMMFSFAHAHISLLVVAQVFVVSVVLGVTYHRHGTLIGVSIVHYVVGVFSLALGFL